MPECRVLVAAAGYGKSHHAGDLWPDAARWTAPDVVTRNGSLRPGLVESGAGTLVVEAVHRLPAERQRALVRAVTSLPGAVAVAFTSRTPLVADLHDLDATVHLVGPEELRLDVGEVERLVRERLGSPDEGSAQRIAQTLTRITGGWPALVVAALAEGPDPWEQAEDPCELLARPHGRVARWVETTLMPSLAADAARLLRRLLDLDPVPRELVVALADDVTAGGSPTDVAAYDVLRESGIVAAAATSGRPRVVPLVARYLVGSPGATAADGGDQQRARWLTAASAWYERVGQPGPSLRAARHAGDGDRCCELIERYGDRIIASGWSAEVLAAAEVMAPAQRSVRVRLLRGHAARVAGRARLADQVLSAVLADTHGAGVVPPPDLAWRLGQVRYGQADYAGVVDCCSGTVIPVDPAEPPADQARRLACLATALRAVGDADAAARAVADALAAARASTDEGAVALVRLAQATLLTGARRHNALSAALGAADQAGDAYLTQRALVNLADAYLTAGEFAMALQTAQRAVDLGEHVGPVGCLATGLHNTGEALLGLGDLDGARVRFLRCLDLARRHGLDRTAAALWGLAQVACHAGRVAESRAALLEVVDLARDSGDRQVLVPALARLATALAAAGHDGDLAEAARLVEEARTVAAPEQQPEVLTALGWVAVARGDRDAPDLAARAVEAARSVPSRRALAPALELRAAGCGDPREAARTLEEALSIHQQAGAALAADRVLVALGRLPGVAAVRGTAARAAYRRLRRAGVSTTAVHPAGTSSGGAIDIRVLGGFEVAVEGIPVAGSAWRSRQARTLLKLLVARHGRPLGREELCETLWPGDDPARTGHRLSVLLSSLRLALDPQRRHPADRFVAADGHGIRLVLGQATLDLRDFLQDADEAARLADDDPAEARRLLADVVGGYRGDAFEEDPYEPWAEEVRHHVRAVWIRSLRLAARLAGRAGDIDDAVTCLVRILAVDPYDEPAHRMLVAVLVRARRHGEARRAFDRWARAMVEAAAPTPDPRVLDAPRADGDHSLTPR